MKKNLGFKQLFEKESSTYTYLLWDKVSKDGIIIDPVRETFERDVRLIKELGIKLKYILDTHVHADHITSSYNLRNEFGAKIVLGKETKVELADELLGDCDKLYFGEFEIIAYSTPGHTDGCTTYRVGDFLFTGDSLLIHSMGRVDFQQGDAKTLVESVNKLYSLGDDLIVYPAHNYEGISNSTIFEEKKLNNFVNYSMSLEESVSKLEKRELPLPKKIKVSVPSNMVCGKEVRGE